jgi:predicted nucleic acid-binding protein
MLGATAMPAPGFSGLNEVAQGRPMPFADGQIAAIAATNGLVLVSRNRSDFLAYRDLATENWFD